MKVLVTGGSGIVGRYLLRQITGQVEAVATYFKNRDFQRIQDVEYYHLDVTVEKDVVDFFKAEQPDVIVHTASVGSVDFSHKHRDRARFVNVGGTRNVAEGAKVCNAKFIFISSNAVFDGENSPYKEEDPLKPINYYGRLKVEGEQIVAASGLEYAIARLILIYGWNYPNERPNPVTWLLSRLKHRQEVKIVADVYCNPLLAGNCAAAICSLILNGRNGIYHIGGRDRVSRFDFAVCAAKAFNLDYKLITPVPSSYFKNIAPRPKDTTYLTKKMEEELRVRPIGIREGLDTMKSEKEVMFWQR
jgi:dTDP-4-dehydrorhamnose reductase